MSAEGRVRSTYESPTEIHRSTSGRVSSAEHVPLDLSWPHNEGKPPQCWTCGLPWPSEGVCTGVPSPEQLAAMLEDPDAWAEGLATEVRRLHGLTAPARTQTPDATP